MINAHKTHCPKGHHLDRVNSQGARYCSACHRETVRRYKKSRKAQVTAHITQEAM